MKHQLKVGSNKYIQLKVGSNKKKEYMFYDYTEHMFYNIKKNKKK